MAKGAFVKANTSTWSNTICKKFTTNTMNDGKIMHANMTTWSDNYPQEGLEETQYFDAVWTQSYNGSGVLLDPPTWGDHPRSGDSIDFKGAWGFNRTAMTDFVGNGSIQSLQIEVKFIDPSHAGNPEVWFAPHVYTSKPPSWNEVNVSTTYQVKSTFTQTGGNFTRWISFLPAAWMGGNMAGIRIDGRSEPSGSAVFAGKTTSNGITAFNTRLLIRVLR